MKINDENEEEKERGKNLKNTAIVLKINKTKIKGKKDKNNGTKRMCSASSTVYKRSKEKILSHSMNETRS